MKKGLRKKNSYIKIAVGCVSLTMVLLFPAVSYALPAGGGFFADDESTDNSSVSASTLDSEVSSTQTKLQLPAVAADILPGNSVTRDAEIENVGHEDFSYRVKFSKVGGSDELCNELEVEAKKNDITVYNDDLFDFTVNAGTLDSGDDDDWDFIVTLPLGASHNVEGESCSFNFQFTAWQTVFFTPTEGWVDEENVTGNAITAGDWPPVISGVANTDPLDTQGSTNNDMSKVSVSWSTNEDTTSNVIYDTTTHAACAGYPLAAPAPADVTADSTDHEVTLTNLTAGSTYYYRVVSADSGGHSVCSDEHSFVIPSSSVDAPTNDIVLNEFVPNPFGADSADKPNGEWVELYNKGMASADVANWVIYDFTDANGVTITNAKTNTGGTTIASNGWLVVYLEKEYLNNSGGDTVRLYNGVIGGPGVSLVDSHSYSGSAPAGKSFARFPDGIGVWIDPEATPGEENELGGEELEQFRTAACTECFDALGNVKKSKRDICQAEFLEYIGMLESKKDKVMAAEMLERFITVGESSIVGEAVAETPLEENVVGEPVAEVPAGESILENSGTIFGDPASSDTIVQEEETILPEENVTEDETGADDVNKIGEEPVIKTAPVEETMEEEKPAEAGTSEKKEKVSAPAPVMEEKKEEVKEEDKKEEKKSEDKPKEGDEKTSKM